jgi:hypothetical protein
LAQEITSLKTWDEKADHLFTSLLVLQDRTQHYRAIAKMIKFRLETAAGYEWNPNNRIKSHTTLLRPTSSALQAEEDYGLSKVAVSLMIYTVL